MQQFTLLSDREQRTEKKKRDMAWVPDVMRNQELEKVLEVNTKIEIN